MGAGGIVGRYWSNWYPLTESSHPTWSPSLELPGARTELTQGETEAEKLDQR